MALLQRIVRRLRWTQDIQDLLTALASGTA